MNSDGIRKKPSREDKAKLNDLVEKGWVTPNRPGNPKKGYSVRVTSDISVEQSTYPGFQDHPSTQGIEYQKHVDTSPTATVWEAIHHDNYAAGGMPTWIAEATSPADISIFWQIVHFQMVWDRAARMSIRTLSRNLGMQYRSVQRCIENLLLVGLIVKESKNVGRKPNTYKAVLPSSITPKENLRKRRESGFVEVTAESVEVTAENSRSNRADTQKTKPLKGLVSEERAEARLATTNEKKKNSPAEPSIPLMTFDQEKKLRKKKEQRAIAQLRKSSASHIRTFHAHEVDKSIIEECLESSPHLHKKSLACIDLAKVSGGLKEATGEVLHALPNGNKSLVPILQRLLTTKHWNVNNLSAALDSCLALVEGDLRVMATKSKQELDTWTRNDNAKQRQVRLEQERDMASALAIAKAEVEALALADATAIAMHLADLKAIETLNECHALIYKDFPNFDSDVQSLGFSAAHKKIGESESGYIKYWSKIDEILWNQLSNLEFEKYDQYIELWWRAGAEFVFNNIRGVVPG